MSEPALRTPRSIFASRENREEFLRDMRSFLDLGAEVRGSVVSFFVNCESIVDDIDEGAVRSFLDENEEAADTEEIKSGLTVLYYLLQRVAAKRITVEGLTRELAAAEFSSEQVDLVTDSLSEIFEAHPQFEADVRGALKAKATLETVSNLSFSSDIRGVENEDGEIVGIVPVLIVRMGFDTRRPDVVFQLSERTLKQFNEMFEEERAKLQKFSQSITFATQDEEPNEP